MEWRNGARKDDKRLSVASSNRTTRSNSIADCSPDNASLPAWMPTLDTLPQKILKKVFKSIHPNDGVCLSLASKRLYEIYRLAQRLERKCTPKLNNRCPSCMIWTRNFVRGCVPIGEGIRPECYPDCMLSTRLASWMPEGLEYCWSCARYTVTITDLDAQGEGDGGGKGNVRGASRCSTCQCQRQTLSRARQSGIIDSKIDGKMPGMRALRAHIVDVVSKGFGRSMRDGSSERWK